MHLLVDIAYFGRLRKRRRLGGLEILEVEGEIIASNE